MVWRIPCQDNKLGNSGLGLNIRKTKTLLEPAAQQ